jgi:hypothetical protein
VLQPHSLKEMVEVPKLSGHWEQTMKQLTNLVVWQQHG